MNYRIEITVSADRVGPVISAAIGDGQGVDPELSVRPILAPPRVEKPLLAKPKPAKKPGNGLAREEVVLGALAQGPKRWSEMKAALAAAGLPEGTLNSLITRLGKSSTIERGGDGLWRLTHDVSQAA